MNMHILLWIYLEKGLLSSVLLLLLNNVMLFCCVIFVFVTYILTDYSLTSFEWLCDNCLNWLWLTDALPLFQVLWHAECCDKSQFILQCCCRLELPPSKQRWVTAAACLSPQQPSPWQPSPWQPLLVCGDRSGNIHVYKIPEMSGITKRADDFEVFFFCVFFSFFFCVFLGFLKFYMHLCLYV